MLKIGIIGSGFGQYGLFPAFDTVKNCDVVALCGKKIKQQYPSRGNKKVATIYSDWRLLIKNEKLDAIALAVTPRAQYLITKVAINKGLHVFAEKPLAVNALKARELLRLAKKKHITHGIDFIFPEITKWKKVKALLDDKIFGSLRHISVNWDFLSYDIKNNIYSWKSKVAEGGGALSFFFSHGLQYIEHFAGPIENVKSSLIYSGSNARKREVGINMALTFKNDVSGQAHIFCNSPNFMRHQLVFQCERGTIVLENKNSVVDAFTITLYGENGAKVLRTKSDKGRKNEDERVKIVRKLAERFVTACARKQQMTPSFYEGARVQELIDKIRAEKIR